MTFEKKLQVGYARVRTELANDKSRLLFCIGVTYLIGLIAHGFAFLNNILSHDALNALYSSHSEDQLKVEIGRFLTPLYRHWFRGNITLPWLIGLVGLFFLALSVYLVVRMFQVSSRWSIVLIAGVMVTNLTMIAQVATYEHDLDYNMLALLFAVSAAYLWKRGRFIPMVVVGGCLGALSMGIYQSYISVMIALIMMFCIFSLVQGKGWKKVTVHGLQGLLMLLVGMAAYTYVSRKVCEWYGVSLQGRVDYPTRLDLAAVQGLVRGTYLWFYETVYLKACYPANFMAVVDGALILCMVTIVIYMLFHEHTIKLLDGCLLVVLVALIPFGTNAVYFVARGTVHDLMHYATWMVYVMACILVGWFVMRSGVSQWITVILKMVCVLSVGALLWQNIVIANTAYLKKDLEEKAELSRMTRVVADLEEMEEYVPGQTPVTFVGVTRFGNGMIGFNEVRNIIGVNYNTVIGVDEVSWYYDTYRAYFEYFMDYTVAWASSNDHNRLKRSEAVQAMPAYPNRGYIQMVDGVLVIKMR